MVGLLNLSNWGDEEEWKNRCQTPDEAKPETHSGAVASLFGIDEVNSIQLIARISRCPIDIALMPNAYL